MVILPSSLGVAGCQVGGKRANVPYLVEDAAGILGLSESAYHPLVSVLGLAF